MLRDVSNRFASALVVIAVLLPILSYSQGARIVKPSAISKLSHSLSVEPSLAGLRLGEKLETALDFLGKPITVEVIGKGEDPLTQYANQAKGIAILV